MTIIAVVAVPDDTDPDELHDRLGRDGLGEHAQYLQVEPFTREAHPAGGFVLTSVDRRLADLDPAAFTDPWPTVVDFVVIYPAGAAERITYDRRRPGESINNAIRRHIPDLGTQGMGRLRMWFNDTFTADLPPNPTADLVVGRLGYRRSNGWFGPVALSMNEDNGTGDCPPLLPEVQQTIDELLAVTDQHGDPGGG